MSDKTAPAHETSGSTRTADASDMQTAKDWFKSVFKLQHAAIIEAHNDRRQAAEDANAARISRLEELILAMNVKNEADARPVQPSPGRVDLQKFRTSDGPIYRRPFQVVEPFLRWIHGVQIFFDTKDVSNSANRIKILGNLIAETNLQSFCANEASGFLTKSWNDFKIRMFDFALPTNWCLGLQQQTSKLGDLQLAQFLVYGLPDALQDRINERQLLEVVPFAYGTFEKQASASFLALHRPTVPPAPTRSTPSAPSNLARDEFVWRVHLYLDSLGLCHFCKKHCGNAAGACPGPIDRSRIDIPSGFATPEKPANYVAPRAWSRPTATPGKPTQPPAGRPSTRAASVAGVTDTTPLEAQVSVLTLDAAIREDNRWDTYFDDEGCFPSLEPAAVAALEDLNSQLLANEIAKAEQADLADAIAGHPGRA
ncbi:uncharacterized protein PGTG_05405 [Puccinia graminis f. sp. tritici CRL 75-36-700-3]|uniref:Uncharacterized protein n=1 Tax=Puccinia graminis f. sp. tritici (strain CRL 75-36-700-3 / race SCCL) TaxID=418459 RepID=E3K474_PUCGT|nr:uncharacterized protein PGTG_05405 [Puccinia graminis f. sp. tritici CRL 75-36-700-3]EFP79084.2 hypothetical protein PGTG_05405 [Puccinia graminis f. sp. tritici CRL 75-36-700-3]